MTDKRRSDPWWERPQVSGETRSTLRSIEAAEVVSPDPESFEQEGLERPVYYQPQPLVAVSNHKTLEIETIKLAQDIDPRRLPTELRLRPLSPAPLDSDWPQPDVVVVSSQPPSAGRRRWRVPVALLLLFGALLALALVLARVVVQRWHAAPVAGVVALTQVGAAPAPSASSAALVPAAAEASSEMGTTPAAAEPSVSAAPPDVAAVSPERTPSAAHASARPNQRRNSPTPNASSRALTAPSVSKPKRAIY